ncbi:hypothetical protein [Hyalangium versicolor]|uniref:hypothetical protein n=1 Tax=Hyalangium versicolor TaxID=2861190 RepID=UPI001CCE1EC9|nr:hypothetical protein [Hyalangium versicolor]
MAFLDEFKIAVSSYPANSVSLSIVDEAVEQGSAGAVNVNEIWKFRVNIANNGHLNMTGVFLQIESQNGALISKSPAGPWQSSVLSSALTVNAHGAQKTAFLYFKAPGVPKPAGTTLVKTHIYTFDANLTDLLNTHSGQSNSPAGVLNKQVYP